MIAASGRLFDGLDLLAVLTLVVVLYLLGLLLNRNWDRKYQPEIDNLLSTENTTIKNVKFSGIGIAAHSAVRVRVMAEGEEWGPQEDTPMPLPFYDWLNEKPMPVVNW